MARRIEEVLSRRMRLLFLDAKAALLFVLVVARLMAVELVKMKSGQAHPIGKETG